MAGIIKSFSLEIQWKWFEGSFTDFEDPEHLVASDANNIRISRTKISLSNYQGCLLIAR